MSDVHRRPTACDRRSPRARVLATFRTLSPLGALLLVLAVTSCAYLPFRHEPPRPGRTKITSAEVTLPAQTIGNFIIVEAKWDRYGPYHFLIDTGSANTLVTPRLAQRYASGQVGQTHVRVASAEGDLLDLPAASLRRLELGGARFDDVPVLVYDLAPLSAHLGIRIDGLLGFPLFRETRLTLDYPHHRVLLQPADSTAPASGTPVPFDDVNRTPVIHVQIGDRRFIVLLDSGSDATLSLNPVGIDAKFAYGPRPGATVGTIGGDHPQQIGRLGEDLSIAGYELPHPIVDLTDELSAVGGGILKHFTVTFDPANDRVMFDRDTHAPITMPTRRSAGVSFSKTPAYWRVAGVIPHSPADAAGIQFGDLVTRINGEPVAKWNLVRFEHLVDTASEVTFTLLFGTNEVDKQVRIFDLVP